MRSGAIVLGFVLLAAFARVARADDAAVAREHAQKATTFYKLARYDDAIREFEAAYEAKADPALLYNLAQCHRLAGHDTDALRLYQNYLRDAPRGPYSVQAEDWIAKLQKSIAEHPPVPPVPATPPPETTPAPPPVDTTPAPNTPPGTPAVVGPAPPAPGAEITPPAPPAETPPAPPAPPTAMPAPAPPPPAPAARSGHRTAGIVIASVGGAFLLGGAAFGLVAKAEAKKVEDAASNHQAFDPAVEKTGRAAELLQWIGYGVGAAGLAVGLILVATSPSGSSESAQPGRVALAPLAGPGLGGALMRVAF